MGSEIVGNNVRAPRHLLMPVWDIATLKPLMFEKMTRMGQTVWLPRWRLEKGVWPAGCGRWDARPGGTAPRAREAPAL